MIRRGITGQIAGTRFEIGWSWLVVLPVVGIALFASTPADTADSSRVAAAAIGAVLLLLSVVGHELGHVFEARRRGIRVERVAVLLLGGYSEMDLDSAGPPGERAVALAGPAVSAFVGVVLWAAAFPFDSDGTLGTGSAPARVLTLLAVVNLGVAAFNLLPAFPLDGGRVVRAELMARGLSRRAAERQAIRVGYVLGVVSVLGGVIASALGSPAALIALPVGVMVFALAYASAGENPEDPAQGI